MIDGECRVYLLLDKYLNKYMRNIIWDFDGTLFDTDGAIVSSFLSVLREKYGIYENENKIRRFIKIDTKECAESLSSEYGLNKALLLSEAREEYDRLGIEAQRPISGASSVCEKVIESGGINALVTHRDKASVERFLDYYDFYKYFACLITCNDNFELKPSPQSFLHVINFLSLEKALTCGVGDRELDVGAANGAQIASYFYCSIGSKSISAKYNITELSELESVIA